MARNLSRRASDGRRSKWKQQNTRARQTETMRSWFAGTAALAVIENARPPKTRVYPSLCDGLMNVLNTYHSRFQWWYKVRIGNRFVEVTEVELLRRWAVFHAQFESAAGVKAGKHTTPTANLLPAPQQPIALLPSGLANAR